MFYRKIYLFIHLIHSKGPNLLQRYNDAIEDVNLPEKLKPNLLSTYLVEAIDCNITAVFLLHDSIIAYTYARYRLCYRPSVRPSICHTGESYKNGSKL